MLSLSSAGPFGWPLRLFFGGLSLDPLSEPLSEPALALTALEVGVDADLAPSQVSASIALLEVDEVVAVVDVRVAGDIEEVAPPISVTYQTNSIDREPQHRSLNNVQYHFEVYLRYRILKLYTGPGPEYSGKAR